MVIPLHEELRTFNALQAEIQGLYHDACVKLGISDSASYILYTLVGLGEGCSPKDIYRNFGVSRQTVHSSLVNLINKNVIELRKGEGRERRIFLTEKGSKLVEERVIPLMVLEDNLLKGWTEEERNDLLRLMRKYRDDFRLGLAKLKIINKPF